MVAGDHANLVQGLCGRVAEAACLALRAAWLHGAAGDARRDPPVPSKATIMSFLTFLAHWTRNWAQQAFLFEKTFEGQRGVDIRAAFVPVLKEMISMAAAMCLRSSAAEAQQGEREKIVAGEDGMTSSLSEAMACRVLPTCCCLKCVGLQHWRFLAVHWERT